MMNCFEKSQAAFTTQFGEAAERVFFAPGRINLIGEHTDYNGGHVFPCALTFGTYALVKKTSRREVRLYSLNFPQTGCIAFSLDNLEYQKEHDWANYPKGVIKYLRQAGYAVDTGMDILFYGEIPNGAGLSSSASIELVTGVLLKEIFGLSIDQLELVKLGKQVENTFIGVNSGIMDQFAVGMGKAGHGILLDCETLKYSYAPITIDQYNIVIMNTNKRRHLADSKYNERRSQCEAALKNLQAKLDITSLGELDEQTFLAHQSLIGDEVLIKRARHAVMENQRTLQAFAALQAGNLPRFGQLINQSHISLRDDYEVTGIELDTLAETSWQQSGVLGARMTGAGFGGCAIAVVEKAQTAGFIEAVGKAYKEKIGYEAAFYLANIGDGAREITKEAVL